MFWECHIVTSSIDKLLDQSANNLKLQDLLDESDLIQECLTQNKRLIDYLIQSEVMSQLVHHVVTKPTDDSFHNAHVVSELLSGDFQRIQEALLQSNNLDILYSFLSLKNSDDDDDEENNSVTLNPILASYFSRILIALIIRRPKELFSYLKSCSSFKEDFLRHLDSTSIADILYRLIADCGEQRSDAIEWYEEINLIDSLIQEFLRTESSAVQMNIVNLLNEFLRLAFDHHTNNDNDIQTGIDDGGSRIERNFNHNEEPSYSSRLSSNSENEEQSTNANGKFTPLILAQHILSKSNLEQLFDALAERPKLVANGCDFLIATFDLLGRYIPAPISIPLSTSTDETTSDKMQINDEEDTPPVSKSENRTTTLATNAKDPLVTIYLTFIEVIPSRLPPLINLLSKPCPPLTLSSSSDSPQTVKYQFISEPLGSMRLNLIKFFCKLLYTISNDYTGDCLYEIVTSNRLLQILVDLFLHHIYNNFLHTQVLLIVRLIFQINSMAAKQSNEVWTRIPLANQPETSNSSSFHYKNRCCFNLFQSLMNPSEVNLLERLLDQYELTIAAANAITASSSSDDALTSALLHTRFTSPNAGHIAQLLRCLRDHASIFDNYKSYMKTTNDQDQIDDNTSALELRWQTALEHLSSDEKKWSAMHNNERSSMNTYAAGLFGMTQSNTSSEAVQRRQTFHARSFGSSGAPYLDDDEDDEVERFNIDDELMNNDQMTSERKVAEMKNTSFEPQFPAVFDEQSLWHSAETKNSTKDTDDNDNDSNMKSNSAPPLPDLFENHRNQKDKSSSSTESSFEQLCSLRANDHGSGPVVFPFQSPSSSSSSIQDEATDKNDRFWHDHPVRLTNPSRHSSSSEENNSDEDEVEESPTDPTIPDDEKFFVHTEPDSKERTAPNNIMDVFRRQSPPTLNTEENSASTINLGQMISEDDDGNATELQNNFSFLIAKGMLRPS